LFLGGFPAEHALDNGGGKRVGVPIDLLPGGGGLTAQPIGGIVYRLLDLAPCSRNEIGAAFERRAAFLFHLFVDVVPGRARSRVEFLGRRLRLGARLLGQLASRTDGALALTHDVREGPKQQPVEQDRQDQHQRDDPDDRKIRNQNKDLYHLETNLDKPDYDLTST
jgi:hypothetical protein